MILEELNLLKTLINDELEKSREEHPHVDSKEHDAIWFGRLEGYMGELGVKQLRKIIQESED